MKTLKQNVQNWINETAKDYNGDKQAVINDLQQGGCSSGMVSHLIYYSDTTAFYDKHKEEINTLLSDYLNEFGYQSPQELFGNKWDKEDSLCLDTNNKNLLSWFAFEEVAFGIGQL